MDFYVYFDAQLKDYGLLIFFFRSKHINFIADHIRMTFSLTRIEFSDKMMTKSCVIRLFKQC